MRGARLREGRKMSGNSLAQLTAFTHVSTQLVVLGEPLTVELAGFEFVMDWRFHIF
jgi:hypothetical protein